MSAKNESYTYLPPHEMYNREEEETDAMRSWLDDLDQVEMANDPKHPYRVLNKKTEEPDVYDWRGDENEVRWDNRGRESRQSYRSQSRIEGITNNASLSLPDYGPEGPTKRFNEPTDVGLNVSQLDPDKLDKIHSLGEEDGSLIHFSVDQNGAGILDKEGWELARPDPAKSFKNYNKDWVTTKDKWQQIVNMLRMHGYNYQIQEGFSNTRFRKLLTEIEIRRLTGDELEPFGDAQVYEVYGDERLTQPVYYLIVDPNKGTVNITSIGLEGDVDNVDTTLIKSLIPVKPAEEDDMGLVYKGDLESILAPLLGNHFAVIQKDIQKVQQSAQDKTWDDVMQSPLDAGHQDLASQVQNDIATFDTFKTALPSDFGDLSQDLMGGAGGVGGAGGLMPPGMDMGGAGGIPPNAAGGMPAGPVSPDVANMPDLAAAGTELPMPPEEGEEGEENNEPNKEPEEPEENKTPSIRIV